MKVLQGFLTFALCTFAQGAKALGLDYTQITDFDITPQGIQTSLERTIGYAKLMIQSMEIKLSEAEKYVGVLEDKLKMCGQNNVLIDQIEKKLMTSEEISKEYLIRIKMLEDRLIKTEQEQIVQTESVTRRLVSLENSLSNIGVLETKLHKAESLISRVEILERKLKIEEKTPFETEQKSSVHDIVQNASPLQAKKTANNNANSDKYVAFNQWNVSSTDRKDNERNRLHFQ
ncbi:hypothetical protein CHS0354_006569 [Potamilus streckersoni]|uniref:Uncharacterized protein n=1 Tax=Potamilus streckersoni TaxID=2493646 RepID=A0AAE0TDK3_9BIVA|nr:hypothetical protein CHS0354_006569 [Potamilus streckersoni]